MGKKVNMFITPKSPHTRVISDFLKERGVDFATFDISRDGQVHKRMIEAARGAGGPPVIEVGHQVVCGFDRELLEETLR